MSELYPPSNVNEVSPRNEIVRSHFERSLLPKTRIEYKSRMEGLIELAKDIRES